MLDFLSLIPFAAFALNLSMFSYVLGQRRNSPVIRSFLIYAFFMFLVPLLDFLVKLPLHAAVVEFLHSLILPIILSLGFLFLNFVLELIKEKRKKLYWLSMVMFIVSVLITTIFPPLEILHLPNTYIYVPSVWLVIAFFLSLIISPVYSLWLCIKRIQRSNDAQLVKQLRLVLIGSLISTMISITAICSPVFLQTLFLMRFASLGILINTAFLFFAIRVHHLFYVDVEKVEHSFNVIFENVHDAVLLLEANGSAVQINSSARKLFNTPVMKLTRSFLEQHIKGYSFIQDGDAISASISDNLDTKDLIISQSLVKRSDASFGKLLIIHDITMQKRAEQQLTREKNLQSIGQLAAGIAHDFNNFLCGIVANISLARLELDAKSNAAQILSQGEATALSARGLTRQILSFSKGSSLPGEIFELNEIIKDTAEFSTRGSDIKLHFESDLNPVFIKGDKTQIRQVIQNIVINAIQSMQQGGDIKIKIEKTKDTNTAAGFKPGNYLKVIIQDQGCGMAPEISSRVFEPYFTTKSTGSGLGLAVAYSIIKNHKGILTIDSKLNQGTTSTIFLPITETQAPVKTIPEDLRVQTSGRILLMDDYAPVRLSLALLLKRLGFSVDEASSGDQALKIFKAAHREGKRYSAVITDLTVPNGMGGCQLAKQLHLIDPALIIIISSGYSEEVEFSDYKSYGFAAALHKPYNINELKKVLASALPKEVNP
ncbi:ATP-binding protein [Chitinispirillales bacterium ANBcel5]|uniref:ATP-binding protein n=1 Tax=Cellulosispirillum alkaliphilum TaxID=3039283 RepID=UPI002A52E7D8|nr:ATP-binding protein [Chitinispirillales bacterium ANBcel5]